MTRVTNPHDYEKTLELLEAFFQLEAMEKQKVLDICLSLAGNGAAGVSEAIAKFIRPPMGQA
jgi:hypothetical protein